MLEAGRRTTSRARRRRCHLLRHTASSQRCQINSVTWTPRQQQTIAVLLLRRFLLQVPVFFSHIFLAQSLISRQAVSKNTLCMKISKYCSNTIRSTLAVSNLFDKQVSNKENNNNNNNKQNLLKNDHLEIITYTSTFITGGPLQTFDTNCLHLRF